MTNPNNPQAASDVTDAEVEIALLAYKTSPIWCGERNSMRNTLESFLQSRAASAQNAAPVALQAEWAPMTMWTGTRYNSHGPLPMDTIVTLKFRAGDIHENCRVGDYSWRDTGSEDDIIAYRIEATPPVGAGGSVPAKFNARDDAERLKSVGRGLSYNDHSEAVWKHTILEIAMRLETDGYIAPRPTPARGDAKDAARFVAFFTAFLQDEKGELEMALTKAIADPKTLDEVRYGIDTAMAALAAKGRV